MGTNRDFRNGLILFCGFALCVCAFFQTPDGDSLFYKLLRLVGINPVIPLGSGSLTIFMLLPLVAGVICARETYRLWKNYRERFAHLNAFVRAVPIYIVVIFGLLWMNLDSIYYSTLSVQSGVHSISGVVRTVSTDSIANYTLKDGKFTYEYSFALKNNSTETREFQVLIVPTIQYPDHVPDEIFILDSDGSKKTFFLPPRIEERFYGEFSVASETADTLGIGGTASGVFRAQDIVLVDGENRVSPFPRTF